MNGLHVCVETGHNINYLFIHNEGLVMLFNGELLLATGTKAVSTMFPN